jgi:hypothetical protein
LFITSGGIKYYSASGGSGSAYVENIDQEDAYSPVLDLATCTSPLEVTAIRAINADPNTSFAGVRANCTNPEVYMGSISVNGGTVDGPATIIGDASPSTSGENPLLENQTGFVNNGVIADTNIARRGFSPVTARFTNLASSVGVWGHPNVTLESCYNGSLSAPNCIAAPDGTSNGWNASTSTSGTQSVRFYSTTHAVSVGDIIIGGAWVQLSASASGYAGDRASPMLLNFSGVTTTYQWSVHHGEPWAAGGEWDWVWDIRKINSTSAASGQLQLSANLSSAVPINIYSPVLIYLPAGTVNDNEAVELAQTLQTYRNDTTAGTVSLLPGVPFQSDYYTGPAVAPSGACSTNGLWVFSQDGHATVCLGGTWTTKI